MTLKIKMMVMPADRAMPAARFPADRAGGASGFGAGPPLAGGSTTSDVDVSSVIAFTNAISAAQARPRPDRRRADERSDQGPPPITQPTLRGASRLAVRPTTTVGGGPRRVHHRCG